MGIGPSSQYLDYYAHINCDRTGLKLMGAWSVLKNHRLTLRLHSAIACRGIR
ncbi:MAG: hypothetical protein AAFY33_10735 [Cyanobacteria bacterium J06643_4]